MKALISSLFIILVGSLQAELIPAARLTDWTPATRTGVVGGIDQYLPGGANQRTSLIDVTQAPYNADNTGATDASGAIQSAINAVTPGQVVYLPAGTYLLNTLLIVGPTHPNITIRGVGVTSILDCRTSNQAIYVGSGSDYNYSYPASGNTIAAGTLSKDSTTLTIADTTAFSAGEMILIQWQNQWDNTTITAGANPVASTGSYPFVRTQTTRLVSKTSSTLTFSPGIYNQPDSNLSAKVTVFQFQGEGIGVEDLKIVMTNGTTFAGIFFEQCHNCWLKNVTSIDTTNYHFFLSNCLHCEIRHCFADNRLGGGSNGAGFLVNTVSGSLIEDNIIRREFPFIEVNHGSCGNVFAYNFTDDSTVFGGPGIGIDANHSPHNSYNLYEGNVTTNFICDGYFGSASTDTVFRNWIQALDAGQQTYHISLKRFTREYSLVGNLLGNSGSDPLINYSFGQPNIGNGDHTGTCDPDGGVFWSDWAAMLIDPPGGGPGSGAFQELDEDVDPSTVRKGNYNIRTTSLYETLGGDSLPNSLFRTSKPSYFASLTWPPFNPLSPGMLAYDLIPAGYRYVHGVDPPLSVNGGGWLPFM